MDDKKNLTEEEQKKIFSKFSQKIENEGFYYFTKNDVIELKNETFSEWNLSPECVEIRLEIASCFNDTKFKKAGNFCVYTDKVKIEKISSLDKYVETISNLDLAENKTRFFRGQQNFAWDAIPSLFREKERIEEEHPLLMGMYRSKPEEFLNLNAFDIISKMQHYGLYTRLMDLTENPLVSLYFACQGSNGNDGRIFIYNVDTYKVKYGCDEEIIEAAKNIFSNKTSENQVYEDDYVFVKADYSNTRISRQFGSFIFPLGTYKEKEVSDVQKMYKNLVELDKTILLIDRNKKHKILEDLKLFGISDATMLAGLDYISKSLTEHNDMLSQTNKLLGYLKNQGRSSFEEKGIKDLPGINSDMMTKVLRNLEKTGKITKERNLYKVN
ncbi:MAG: FRG domain-containing protein [Treponemataceae bacterium]|nr:FRG domain-containing protein [Treponemataceae bacterium]